MRPEFDRIMQDIVNTVHDHTTRSEDMGHALHVIGNAARVLSAINRALTIATTFVDSQGRYIHRSKGA